MAESVVVTGVGAVTPLGMGPETLYKRWRAAEVGIIDGLGRCVDFDGSTFFARRELTRMDRFTQLAAAAADDAMTAAGWARHDHPYRPHRIGCVIASGGGGLDTLLHQHERYLADPALLSAYTLVKFMPNAAASVICERWGLRGESFAVAGACASGTLAFGQAIRMLRDHDVDAVVVGGAEAPLTPAELHLFSVMGALSKVGVSRPFDRSRDGFVLAESAGALVLERDSDARARSAPILGEVLGFGASTDAFDLSAPDPSGSAAADAITKALNMAGLTPSDICYVNAHGTGSRHNDAAETNALKLALGQHAWRIPVSSTKSSIGHSMGAAGTIEAIATLYALSDGVAPPTLGLTEPDDGLDLNYVPHCAQTLDVSAEHGRVGISNSFGLGGVNAVVVLRAPR